MSESEFEQIPPINDVADLKSWLHEHKVDTSRWGETTTLGVETLYDESKRGESLIYFNGDNPYKLKRFVSLAIIHIHSRTSNANNPTKRLDTYDMLFPSGTRERQTSYRPLAVRARIEEPRIEAAGRVLSSIIGTDIGLDRIDQVNPQRYESSSKKRRTEEQSSRRYPGLTDMVDYSHFVTSLNYEETKQNILGVKYQERGIVHDLHWTPRPRQASYGWYY